MKGHHNLAVCTPARPRRAWTAASFAWIFLTAPPTFADKPLTEEESGLRAAKEAYVLLVDNQDRCQRLIQRLVVRMLPFTDSIARSGAYVQFLKGEGRQDLAMIDRSLELSGGLTDLTQTDNMAVVQGLSFMYQTQSEVRTEIKQGGNIPGNDLLLKVNTLQQGFEVQKQLVAVMLLVSEDERDAILAKYRDALLDVGSANLLANDGEVEPLEPIDPLSARKMTPEEYAKEKAAYEDWLAEQERLERERVGKIQLRQDEGAQAPMPKVGVVVPPPPPPPPTRPLVDLGAMQGWHRRYLARIPPVKTAISQYLQSRNSGNKAMLSRSCQKLSQTTATFLADAATLNVPDPVVQEPLRNAIAAFKQGADACFMGEIDTAKEHVSAAEKFLGEAAQALRPYNLSL